MKFKNKTELKNFLDDFFKHREICGENQIRNAIELRKIYEKVQHLNYNLVEIGEWFYCLNTGKWERVRRILEGVIEFEGGYRESVGEVILLLDFKE